jgi:hypothetical protein
MEGSLSPHLLVKWYLISGLEATFSLDVDFEGKGLQGFVLKGWDGVGVFDGSGYRRWLLGLGWKGYSGLYGGFGW